MTTLVETPGPIDQAITQNRLTLKEPYLAFLGRPTEVEFTYGPMNSFLIHNPQRRREFVSKILPPPGTPLKGHQDFVERLLVSGRRVSPVDDHGRIRIEKVHLGPAGLEANSQAYLMPREAYGWIEVWSEKGYYEALCATEDKLQVAITALLEELS
jgi:DNA-binding transcriptional regulator/RsmH inhibitor MraZ